MKTAITSDAAPAAIGPYSQAIRSGNFLFLAGQIPLDPATGELAGDTIDAQARQVMNNIRAVLAAAGAGFEHVVKATIFLTDLANFQVVNAIYAACFSAPFPARSTIQIAALPKGAMVEIEVVACLPGT